MRWLVFLLLAGCDNLSGGKDIQPELTQRATREAVLVIPNWQTAEGVTHFCGPNRRGCARRYMTDTGWAAIITAVEPKDFNDFNATETLGHECYHAFGAMHE